MYSKSKMRDHWGALELMTNFFMLRTKSSLWLLAWGFTEVETKVEAEVKVGKIINDVLEAVLTRAGPGFYRSIKWSSGGQWGQL